MKKLSLLLLVALVLVLTACSGGGGGPTANASPTVQAVNGFGTAQNHTHSMVILPDASQTIVLATHYGIFRSQDHGSIWQETAAGPHQLMQGLMTWWLSYNPLNPQRLYVLTLPALFPHAGIPGLYTSGDGGKTWSMSIAYTSLPSGTVYLAQAGNSSPNEVYIYISSLGPKGLEVSEDNGAHFSQAGTLPFGSILGILPIPNQPGHMFVYGNEGTALTTDGGKHWQVIKSLQDSIFEMTTPGANQPIYARGGNVYVSHDGGQSFTVASQSSYASLQTLVADPSNPNQVYLALSYPTETYHFVNNAWQSITPPAS